MNINRLVNRYTAYPTLHDLQVAVIKNPNMTLTLTGGGDRAKLAAALSKLGIRVWRPERTGN